MKQEGGDLYTVKKKNKCEHCNKIFASKFSLIRHDDICKDKFRNELQTYKDNNITNLNNKITLDTKITLDINKILGITKLLELAKPDNRAESLNIFLALTKNEPILNNQDKNISNKNVQSNSSIDTQQSNCITFDSLLNPIEEHITSNVTNINNTNTNNTNTNNTNTNNTNTNNTNNNITNKDIQTMNQNVNNGVINNNAVHNSITMPFINPFGLENIDFLTNDDMKTILTNCGSLDGVVIAFDKIYSKMENKNFHKRNMNKDNITVVKHNLGIEVYKEDDFKKYLLKNIIFLLRRIFFQCMDNLSFTHQYTAWKNINLIEEIIFNCTDDSELIKKISNMIDINSENRLIKKMFENFKKAIMDNNFVVKSMEKVNIECDNIKKYNTALQTVNANMNAEFLKEEVWMRDENDSDDINLNNEFNNINTIRYEKTPRYKFYNDMKNCELNYIGIQPNSLGDINKIITIHDNRALEEVKLQKSSFDPTPQIYAEVYDKLITDVNSISKQKAYKITFIKNIQNNKIEPVIDKSLSL
jgi:hypothetical protein